jgi:hypothetical protein
MERTCWCWCLVVARKILDIVDDDIVLMMMIFSRIIR